MTKNRIKTNQIYLPSKSHSKPNISLKKRSQSPAIATSETSDETDSLIERIALERDYYHTCTYGEY